MLLDPRPTSSTASLFTLLGLLFTAGLWQTASTAWTRSNMAINEATCTSSDATYLSQAMYNIQSMLMSTISGLETIESNLGRKRDDLDPGDKAKLDIFMSLYGEFDPTNKDAITTAENIITNIEWMADQLLSGLESDCLEITIFCSTDRFHDMGNGWYSNPAQPNMLWIPAADLCPTGLRAMMQETQAVVMADGEHLVSDDVLIVCKSSFEGEDKWLLHIDHYNTEELHGIEGISLDEIVLETGEPTLLHELTHAKSFFANNALDDIKDAYGTDAYKWDLCVELAADEETRTSAVKNADTFAYLSAGLYMSQCNWKGGTCVDPSEAN